MKLITPEVELLSITPNTEELIELAGRTAYQSADKIGPGTAAKFIKMILARGHESVLEHASATIRFVVDRGVTHEMVRHRIASYTQESTRYCNYSADKFDNGIRIMRSDELSADQMFRRIDLYKHIEAVYLKEIEERVSPQIARDVLPTVLRTEIVTTYNLREWRHYFRLRCAPTAHPRIQFVSKLALRLLLNRCPAVFDDLKSMLDFTNGGNKA